MKHTMKHTLTSIAAIVAVAGFAVAAHAQSMTPPGTSPAQNTPTSQYTGQNPSPPTYGTPNSYGAAPNQYSAQQQQNQAQQGSMQQQPGMASQNGMQQPGMQQPGMAAQNQMPRAGAGSQNLSRDEVRGAQQALREQGLYRGRDDGRVGASTARAIAQFQRRNGLRATGTLDQETLSSLNGTSNTAYGASAGQTSGQTAPGSAAPMPSAASPGGGYNTGAGNYSGNPGAYNPPNPAQR